MDKYNRDKSLQGALVGMDAGETRSMLEKELILSQQHLRELPTDSDPLDRAQVKLDIAQSLLGLGRNTQSWNTAREIFDVFIDKEAWQEATEACNIMYQSDQELSIAALGQGVWLAVTYPVEPELTVAMLHHIVTETPDNSDGGAVAAAVAHYIADLRTEGRLREDLMYFTARVLVQVAERHRGITTEDEINLWMEMLQLNDPKELLSRLAKIIDVIVEQNWWINRDALRARLPVN